MRNENRDPLGNPQICDLLPKIKNHIRARPPNTKLNLFKTGSLKL